MLGVITLIVAIAAQAGFLIYRIVTGSRQSRVKHIARILVFAVFSLLLLTGVYWWGFRWMGLFILLAVQAVLSVIYFVRRPKAEKSYKLHNAVFTCISGCVLIALCILPGILFPQFTPIAPTGAFEVGTQSVTFVDVSCVDPFSDTGESRKLTVQFWYPANRKISQTFPLIIFSHGAFGYRGSNLSTFENLAANGYIVCSIDHSSHAFISQHTDGSKTLVNMDFLNDAMNIGNGGFDEKKTYELTQDWLALRNGDMNFILDEILRAADTDNPEGAYALINTDEIGLFGHSLGGATAAQLGRERNDIDAVIVIDGTMLGEQVGFENGKPVLNASPYPVPLLNLYNDRHYEDAIALGTAYDNISARANALEAYDVVIRGSGHLNFTDLPLFSPKLAEMHGTGEVDSRYCIETMNQLILTFFDYALKDTETLNLQTEY